MNQQARTALTSERENLERLNAESEDAIARRSIRITEITAFLDAMERAEESRKALESLVKSTAGVLPISKVAAK